MTNDVCNKQRPQYKIENRIGRECRRLFQNVSIWACVVRHRDCVGVGLERDIDVCRAQPWNYQYNYVDDFIMSHCNRALLTISNQKSDIVTS